MRLSTREGDAGYDLWQSVNPKRQIKVFLDGIERHYVEIADEEGGFIESFVVDGQGNLLIDPKRDEPVHEHLTGVVRIELPAGLNGRH